MRIEQLTFTRFIAALTVVIFHYGSTVYPFNIEPSDKFFQAGPIAVSYFYALSGFIMAVAYYRPATPQSFNKWKFWLARLARIYPVYLVALLLVALPKFKELPDTWGGFVLNLTMLQSWIPGYPLSFNAPGWSLSVEAFFYLCFPVLLAMIYKAGSKYLIFMSIVLWVATQILHTIILNSSAYTPFSDVHDFIYYNPLMHLNTFVTGLVIGVLFIDKKQTSTESSNKILLLSATILIFALLMMQPQIENLLNFRIDYTNGLIAPVFLLFILMLAKHTGATSRIFNHPLLVLLGEASFSLYILQRPVHGIYEKFIATKIEASNELHFYFYLIFLIAISILSYKLFETPARKVINRLYKPN